MRVVILTNGSTHALSILAGCRASGILIEGPTAWRNRRDVCWMTPEELLAWRTRRRALLAPDPVN